MIKCSHQLVGERLAFPWLNYILDCITYHSRFFLRSFGLSQSNNNPSRLRRLRKGQFYYTKTRSTLKQFFGRFVLNAENLSLKFLSLCLHFYRVAFESDFVPSPCPLPLGEGSCYARKCGGLVLAKLI